MPPRHAYWTIILEGKPTAFRAHEQEELLPTLKQLQTHHPDAVMKWFARGRLWDSREEQRAAAHRRPASAERRGPDWRPGGRHEDPRQRFDIPRDEKRRRFADKQRRERGAKTPGPGGQERPPRDNRPAGPSSSFRPDWRPQGGARKPFARPQGGPGGRPPRGESGEQRNREAGGSAHGERGFRGPAGQRSGARNRGGIRGGDSGTGGPDRDRQDKQAQGAGGGGRPDRQGRWRTPGRTGGRGGGRNRGGGGRSR